jgi:hypothetical protein
MNIDPMQHGPNSLKERLSPRFRVEPIVPTENPMRCLVPAGVYRCRSPKFWRSME